MITAHRGPPRPVLGGGPDPRGERRAPHAGDAPRPVRRSEYAHLLADLTGVTEASVVQALDARRRGKPAAEVEAPATPRLGAGQGRARDAEAPGSATATSTRPGPGLHRGALPQRRDARPRSRRSARRAATPRARGRRGRQASPPPSSQLAVEPLDGEPTPEYARARLGAPRGVPPEDASATHSGSELQKLNPTDGSGLRPALRGARRGRRRPAAPPPGPARSRLRPEGAFGTEGSPAVPFRTLLRSCPQTPEECR